MKTKLLSLILLGALYSCQTGPSEKVSRVIPVATTDEHKPKTVGATIGDIIEISLPSNPTTGYSWTLKPTIGENKLRTITSVYNAPQTKLAGAGGTQTFTFIQVFPGTEELVFEYKRPWEKDIAPIKTQRVTVNAR